MTGGETPETPPLETPETPPLETAINSLNMNEPRFMNEEIMTQIQEKPSLKSSFYSILGLEFKGNQVDLNEKVIKKAVRWVVVVVVV